MSSNQTIRNRRIELGLQEADVADRAGLSVQEYADIEQHEDELASVTDLARAKRLCAVLRLPVAAVFGLTVEASSESVPSRDTETLAEARISKGLTMAQLADDLGMEEWVIGQIESKASAIEQWPFEFVAKYAHRLGLPIARFLA